MTAYALKPKGSIFPEDIISDLPFFEKIDYPGCLVLTADMRVLFFHIADLGGYDAVTYHDFTNRYEIIAREVEQ